jgi:GTP-binding protein Era
VTLLGQPNAGKSTLMNALIGETLSIVTPKPQTTWQRVTGILTTSTAQMVFLDTPGILAPKDLLQRAMRSAAQDALAEADVILLVVDGSEGWDPEARQRTVSVLADGPSVPLLVAINKSDLISSQEGEALSGLASRALGGETFLVSAMDSTGVEPLKRRLEELLPTGPFLYPPDEIARDPVRFFVSEMIRETVFQEYHEEIPYSTFCQIEEFREGEDPIYIQAHLFVERKSQKRILIGRGGSSIRTLGVLSRQKIEAFLGRKVYLDLWVKVLPDWRKRRTHLKRLGFPVPNENAER